MFEHNAPVPLIALTTAAPAAGPSTPTATAPPLAAPESLLAVVTPAAAARAGGRDAAASLARRAVALATKALADAGARSAVKLSAVAFADSYASDAGGTKFASDVLGDLVAGRLSSADAKQGVSIWVESMAGLRRLRDGLKWIELLADCADQTMLSSRARCRLMHFRFQFCRWVRCYTRGKIAKDGQMIAS